MDKDLAQFKDMFIESVKENVRLLSDSLLKIEKNTNDKAAIEDAFRASHSIKGEGASMDYVRLAYLAHAVEDVLYEVKKERMALTSDIADCLFGALDAISRSVAEIETSGQDLDVSQEIEKVKQITGVKTEGFGPSIRSEEPTTQTTPAPQPPPEAPITSIKSKKTSAKSADQTVEPKPEKPAPAPARTDQLVDGQDSYTSSVAPEQIRTISVKVEQIDSMMSLIEELIVHRLTLGRLVQSIDNPELTNYHHQVEKIMEALQFEIMRIRAVPLKVVFDHYPRAVRDLARQANKQISLVIEGDDLALDRTIVERLDTPLTHIIRNAASHGIDKEGIIRLSARRDQDYALIEIADNGEGVDWRAVADKAGVQTTDAAELKDLLFSGISTAEAITQVSGRGVGLKAVKQIIEEMGGTIDVESTPEKGGTTFIVRLPLTLAVMKALLVSVAGERYAIPAGSVDRSIKIENKHLAKTAGQEAFVLDEVEVPLLRLDSRLGLQGSTNSTQGDVLAVIVMVGKERLGLVVDEIIEASDMVIKPVPDILKGNRIFGGATILGDGRSALILNPGGLT